eukprot:SAG22_NODE_831_length_6940_cov_12.139599_3_plen_325_part_00
MLAFDIAEDGLSLHSKEPADRAPAGSVSPCHISLCPAGLLVSHMAGGALSCIPLQQEGPGDMVQSAAETRQLGTPWWEVSSLPVDADPRGTAEYTDGPHAHCAVIDPSGSRAVVTNYGQDQLAAFDIGDASAGALLTACSTPPHRCAAGAGPRHAVFDSSGAWLLVANANDSTIESLAYDAGSGRLESRCVRSTLPSAEWPENSAVSLVAGPAGFVHVANSGHDSVATFRLDASTGQLELCGHLAIGMPADAIEWVPACGASGSGWLLVGSGRGRAVQVLRVKESGELALLLQGGGKVEGLDSVSDFAHFSVDSPRATANRASL